MSSNYVAIPDDRFGWLAAAVHARHELGELAALAVAILEGAGATPDAEAT